MNRKNETAIHKLGLVIAFMAENSNTEKTQSNEIFPSPDRQEVPEENPETEDVENLPDEHEQPDILPLERSNPDIIEREENTPEENPEIDHPNEAPAPEVEETIPAPEQEEPLVPLDENIDKVEQENQQDQNRPWGDGLGEV